jgi:hypothetical protein
MKRLVLILALGATCAYADETTICHPDYMGGIRCTTTESGMSGRDFLARQAGQGIAQGIGQIAPPVWRLLHVEALYAPDGTPLYRCTYQSMSGETDTVVQAQCPAQAVKNGN